MNFLSIFVYISGFISPITLICVLLERSFPPRAVQYRWFQFWSKLMTSEVEERPRLVRGQDPHRSQRVNKKPLRSKLFGIPGVLRPKFWATQNFWAARQIFGQSQLLKVFSSFFWRDRYFYFYLKSACKIRRLNQLSNFSRIFDWISRIFDWLALNWNMSHLKFIWPEK